MSTGEVMESMADSKSADDQCDDLDDTDTGGFPTDTLPEPVRTFVESCAKALPVAPDLVAVPALVAVGAAVGNARRVQIKPGWQESTALYAAVVADTGSMKSPALAAACEPITIARLSTQSTWTTDATVERLGELLQDFPRGVLVIKDELTGWVRSFNQYKQGKGADLEFFLSAWSGTATAIERKQTGRILVPRPFLAVVGCLPPDLVATLTNARGGEDGFLPRILFAWPKAIPVRFTDQTVSEDVRAKYHELVQRLSKLDTQPGQTVVLPLTGDAYKLFWRWHDEHCEEMENPQLLPGMAGFYSKLKGYCARLALIHALGLNPETEVVGEESIAAAAAQVDYFKTQAVQVLSVCRSVGAEQGQQDKCKESIRRTLLRYGPKSKRQVQRNSNYDAKVFNPAWDALCSSELVAVGDGEVYFHDLALGGTDTPTTDTPAKGRRSS